MVPARMTVARASVTHPETSLRLLSMLLEISCRTPRKRRSQNRAENLELEPLMPLTFHCAPT